MSLIYAGIDEAGYGPMLGPLCVGLAVFRITDWSPGDPPPDMWEMLDHAVCRTARDARTTRRIPYADSKKLKGANNLKTVHPLRHLERGVLAVQHAAGIDPHNDSQLLGALGAELPDLPWWAGEPAALPLSGTVGELRIAGGMLKREMDKAGVELLSLRCRVIGVEAFNAIARDEHSKAATVEAGLVEHLRFVRTNWGGSALRADNSREPIRIACDRQSGRTDYRGVLGRAWPDTEFQIVEQSPRASVYTAGDGLGVQLTPEAEDRHLPVALASMCAKFVRELAMARFNRYWRARAERESQIELKPTAGYVQDARRWIDEMRGMLSDSDRKALIRVV